MADSADSSLHVHENEGNVPAGSEQKTRSSSIKSPTIVTRFAVHKPKVLITVEDNTVINGNLDYHDQQVSSLNCQSK